MSEGVPRRTKGPPAESELSQILAHARACREAFGPYIGALVLIFTIMKARQGFFGVTTAVSVVAGIIYHSFLRQ